MRGTLLAERNGILRFIVEQFDNRDECDLYIEEHPELNLYDLVWEAENEERWELVAYGVWERA